jgi:thioredoxin reductase (NADPH)
MKKAHYDLAIIGRGPAGLCGSIYASRYGIDHIVIGEIAGGQISEAHEIDNYPGLPGVSGREFAEKMRQHADKYQAEIVTKKVSLIKKEDGLFSILLSGGGVISARSLLLAGGIKKRKLNIPREEKFIGKGVSYCATCDGFFYKGKKVAVVGGSDSAAGAAVYLGKIAEEVIIIYRKEKLRAEKYWINLISENKKIRTLFNANIKELIGDDFLEGVVLDSGEKIELDGIFIEAGSEPEEDFLSMNLERDEKGSIVIQKDGQTSLEGVWAAGDITNGSDNFHQVVTAVAEGAIAARSVYKHLEKIKADEKHQGHNQE